MHGTNSVNAFRSGSAALMPNPSVNRTRYGRRRKAGAQRLRHCRAPALRRLPPRAGYLERYTSVESQLIAIAFRGRSRELPLGGECLSRIRPVQSPVHAATAGRRPTASPMRCVRAWVSLGVFSHRGRSAVREQSHLLSAGQESLARRISLTHNPSLVRTHSGMPRKPAVLYSKHRRTSGLRGTPTRSAQLER